MNFDASIPIEQAGFRPKRSNVEQVMALTTYIENGFQKCLKTGAVFVDLTAAYDTVWREGLLLKLAEVIPCKKLITVFNEMLSNRFNQVQYDKSKNR